MITNVRQISRDRRVGLDRAHRGADYAALFDMHMMCWGTGRERTIAEYRGLLEAGGWSFKAAWFPRSGAIGVVEGSLAS